MCGWNGYRRRISIAKPAKCHAWKLGCFYAWSLVGLLLVLPQSACLLADSPSSQVAPAPSAASGKSKSFAEALRLTASEATALTDVRDRASQLDETAFYMMLSKAAGIAALADQQLHLLDRPVASNLLAHPQRYRGWPIRLRLRVYRVEKLVPGAGLSASPYWAADRPVWKLVGVDSKSDDPLTGLLVVFSIVEPSVLGAPDRVGQSGEGYYNHGRDVELAGISYKLYRTEDLQGNIRDYPVVVAWRLEIPAAGKKVAETKTPSRSHFIYMLLAGLLVMYLFAKRYARRKAAEESRFVYRPLRDELGEPPGDPAEAPAKTEKPTGGTGGVDPMLKEAAEEYRKQKERDNAAGEDRSS